MEAALPGIRQLARVPSKRRVSTPQADLLRAKFLSLVK
jgi:hypothetical protein